MTHTITEIQIIPVKPNDGLLGFASFVLDGSIYLGSVGIFSRLEGGYRLVYPTKKVGNVTINIFHPINRSFASQIEIEVVTKFEEVMTSNDRYSSSNT